MVVGVVGGAGAGGCQMDVAPTTGLVANVGGEQHGAGSGAQDFECAIYDESL